MTDEEKQAKAEQIKKNLTEMVKNEIFQITSRAEIMKLIRKEVRKQVKEATKYYIQEIMPSDEEISDIVREAFLAMGEKKKC